MKPSTSPVMTRFGDQNDIRQTVTVDLYTDRFTGNSSYVNFDRVF